MADFCRKAAALMIAVMMTVFCLPVHAEDDFSDTSYWNTLCTNTNTLNEEQQASCAAYMSYMAESNAALKEQIAAIDARKDEINANIASYAENIGDYDSQISGLNGMIEDLSMQINGAGARVEDVRLQIEENKKAITAKEDEIENLKDLVSDRIERQQETMRTNVFVDILMGAGSLSEFIRIAEGLSEIYKSDARALQDLNAAVDELTVMRTALEKTESELTEAQQSLENGKALLDARQAELLASKYEAEMIRTSYEEQLADADSELNKAKETITGNEEKIGEVSQSISDSEENMKTPEPTATPQTTAEPEKTADAADPQPSAAPENSPESTPEATPEPTPEADGNPSSGDSSGNPFYGGWSNCTWGAWQLVHDTLGISLPDLGYSTDWLANAQALGYATGSEPAVNAVAVYINHVAFVAAVDGDQVYIKEGNYLGSYAERWVPKTELPYTGQTCLGYIYLP
jgi:peptidoglycan hydrolase CwlO-like protein